MALETLFSGQPLYPAFDRTAQYASTEDTVGQPDYIHALHDGAVAEHTVQDETGMQAVERYTLHLHALGELVVTSEHIVTCDHLAMPDTLPLADTVPPDHYSVILSVAELPSGDQRVACALLRLREPLAVRWEMAVPQGRTLHALKPGISSATRCRPSNQSCRPLPSRCGPYPVTTACASDCAQSGRAPADSDVPAPCWSDAVEGESVAAREHSKPYPRSWYECSTDTLARLWVFSHGMWIAREDSRRPPRRSYTSLVSR